MINVNSINTKINYLNIIFLILILLSVKDIIFKSDIYILEIEENLNAKNINNINKIFNQRYNMEFIIKGGHEKFMIPDKTLLFAREHDALKNDVSYQHIRTFFTDKLEFYKVISRFQTFGYDEKIKYSSESEIINYFCNEFDDPNPSFYIISIKCAGIGPAHYSKNEFIKFDGNLKHGIFVYDATRERLSKQFYKELFNYLNATLSYNTSVNGNGFEILKIVNIHDIKLNVFLKRLTYLVLFYLMSLLLIIIFQKKAKNV
jgi:hypothetical protein